MIKTKEVEKESINCKKIIAKPLENTVETKVNTRKSTRSTRSTALASIVSSSSEADSLPCENNKPTTVLTKRKVKESIANEKTEVKEVKVPSTAKKTFNPIAITKNKGRKSKFDKKEEDLVQKNIVEDIVLENSAPKFGPNLTSFKNNVKDNSNTCEKSIVQESVEIKHSPVKENDIDITTIENIFEDTEFNFDDLFLLACFF